MILRSCAISSCLAPRISFNENRAPYELERLLRNQPVVLVASLCSWVCACWLQIDKNTRDGAQLSADVCRTHRDHREKSGVPLNTGTLSAPVPRVKATTRTRITCQAGCHSRLSPWLRNAARSRGILRGIVRAARSSRRWVRAHKMRIGQTKSRSRWRRTHGLGEIVFEGRAM